MQQLDDIFRIFGEEEQGIRGLAEATGNKPDTVYRWSRSGRIPESQWPAVIAAARERGQELTADDLLAANRTPRMRGAPSHQPKAVA